jgi:hypothetical protein
MKGAAEPSMITLQRFIAGVEGNAHAEAIEEFYAKDSSMQENQSRHIHDSDLPRPAPPHRRLRGQDPERHQALRSAGHAADADGRRLHRQPTDRRRSIDEHSFFDEVIL